MQNEIRDEKKKMNNLKKDAAKTTCVSCGSKINPKSFFRTQGTKYFCCKKCLEKWDIAINNDKVTITLKEREDWLNERETKE
jgi:recombinational DNA repair protein (RecF pathway)